MSKKEPAFLGRVGNPALRRYLMECSASPTVALIGLIADAVAVRDDVSAVEFLKTYRWAVEEENADGQPEVNAALALLRLWEQLAADQPLNGRRWMAEWQDSAKCFGLHKSTEYLLTLVAVAWEAAEQETQAEELIKFLVRMCEGSEERQKMVFAALKSVTAVGCSVTIERLAHGYQCVIGLCSWQGDEIGKILGHAWINHRPSPDLSQDLQTVLPLTGTTSRAREVARECAEQIGVLDRAATDFFPKLEKKIGAREIIWSHKGYMKLSVDVRFVVNDDAVSELTELVFDERRTQLIGEIREWQEGLTVGAFAIALLCHEYASDNVTRRYIFQAPL